MTTSLAFRPFRSAVPPPPMVRGDVSAATARFAARYLECATLRSRLANRPAPGAVPASRIDTVRTIGALAPLLGTDAPARFTSDGDGDAVRRMLAPLPGGRTLAVDAVPATVRFEGADLWRLLLELVDNAWRGAPAGATVRVRGAVGSDGYQLSVTNPGERLPRWALASMRLAGGEIASADPSGVALGLPIAAALAALNHAKLEVLRAAGRPNTLRVIARMD
jgi:hypothetical protein